MDKAFIRQMKRIRYVLFAFVALLLVYACAKIAEIDQINHKNARVAVKAINIGVCQIPKTIQGNKETEEGTLEQWMNEKCM